MRFLFSVLVFSFHLTSLAQISTGLYSINGLHSERGPYQGEMLVTDQVVQRVIRYQQFTFKGFQVEEVLVGQRNSLGQIQFVLKPSDVFTHYDGFTFPQEVFRGNHDVVISQLGVMESPLIGRYTESVMIKGNYNGQSLVSGQYELLDVMGDHEPFLVSIARWLVINKIIKKYRELPETKPWHDRPEWKSGKQYKLVDRTDFDFLRSHPQTIRLRNKILSPISLGEGIQKANAYGKSLHVKAQYLENETKSYNLNSTGILEMAKIDPTTRQKIHGFEEYDSALWSSMFLLSQVLKYEVTGATEDYETAKKTIDAMVTLVDITGSPSEFARGLLLSPPSQDLGEGWVQGQGIYSHLKWRKGGNNDMVKGVLMSFVLAHRVLKPTETELIQKIQRVAPKLITLEPNVSRAFNLGLAYGALALWSNNPEYIDEFYSRVEGLESFLADSFDVDTGFHTAGMSDWSGIHLNCISTLNKIFVSQELIRRFGNLNNVYKAKRTLKSGQDNLNEIHKGFRKAQRHFPAILNYAFGNPKLFDDSFKSDVAESVWALREMPAPRFVGGIYAQLTMRGDWSISSWPSLPWKAVKGPLTFERRRQGAYSYPLYLTHALRSTYVWKDNPFYDDFGSNPEVISFSSDYLMLYWAAVRSGLVSKQD